MIEPEPRRPSPWRAADLLSLYAAVAAGLILLLVAWWAVSETAALRPQIRWLNLGIVGLIMGGAGMAMWLLAGRRAIARRMGALVAAGVGAPSRDGEVATLVAGSRMTRYHRATCPLVAGKRVGAAPLSEHRRAGRRPCGVCAP